MIVEKYGISLKRITLDDIELVREKRNSEYISSRMIFREKITAEQQLIWFNSVNNFHNFYYLIYFEGKPIGLINDKDINWQKRTSEAGLFIWEKQYLKTIVPSLAALCLLEMGFEVLTWDKTTIKVLKSNNEAIAFNKQVGFKNANILGEAFEMELNREDYLKKSRRMILSLTKLQEKKELRVTISNKSKELLSKINKLISDYNVGVCISKKDASTMFEYNIKV
jgi:RimJ/RimL family protein N-acetyltransferase